MNEAASRFDWEYDDELARKVRYEEILEEVREKARKDAAEEVTSKVAKNMLRENYPMPLIAKITGWTEEKILQVAKDI